ncbi:MAG: hypothetical protein JKY14_08730 [Paraglaciecola sp.]|nr:hypothetical protein [Paraglaciecola sp.]
MRNVILVTSLLLALILTLSACVQPIAVANDSPERESNETEQVLTEKSANAKYQLEKTVEEGQLSDLRYLKNNIELHCVWRRN